MATVKLWTDEEVAADGRVKVVFDDIRASRKSDFVNNFWRALANQPVLLERIWASIKQVMIEPGSPRSAHERADLYRSLCSQFMQLLRALTYCARSLASCLPRSSIGMLERCWAINAGIVLY